MGWLVEPHYEHQCTLPKLGKSEAWEKCVWQCDECSKIYEVQRQHVTLAPDPRDPYGPSFYWRNSWHLRVVKRIS